MQEIKFRKQFVGYRWTEDDEGDSYLAPHYEPAYYSMLIDALGKEEALQLIITSMSHEGFDILIDEFAKEHFEHLIKENLLKVEGWGDE
tara:strand:- start:1793 stop:2059 length:267 start_codon:yes stop_codon:yes gene_type:complete